MFTSLTNLFFPAACAGCDAFLLHNETAICTRCRHEIPLTYHHLQQNNEAFQKFYGKIPVVFAIALMYYHKSGIAQEMIRKLKYCGHESVGEAIGQWYSGELLSAGFAHDVDEIIPVPLHRRRLSERGYNQVTRFAEALGDGLNIPVNSSLLVRNLYSKTQTKKNLLGRTEIDKSLFEADYTIDDHGKHFLVVDDVLTTGSTLEACGKALLKIPDAKVSFACMAMSHS